MSGAAITKTEPVAIGAVVIALINATIAVLIGFGVVHWTSAQIGQIDGLFTALIVAVAAVARSRVTPVAAPTATVALPTPPAP